MAFCSAPNVTRRKSPRRRIWIHNVRSSTLQFKLRTQHPDCQIRMQNVRSFAPPYFHTASGQADIKKPLANASAFLVCAECDTQKVPAPPDLDTQCMIIDAAVFPYCKSMIAHRKSTLSRAFSVCAKSSGAALTDDTGTLDTLYQELLAEEVQNNQRQDDHQSAGVVNRCVIQILTTPRSATDSCSRTVPV